MAQRGRPRSFDRTAALGKAMDVFWAKGYEGASMADLTEAMGIASPSLYAAFGNKEALFQEAVALYHDSVGKDIWDPLEAESSIVDAIETFLHQTAKAYSDPSHPSGCLIVLGALHRVGGEDVPGEILREHRLRNADRLRDRLQRAVAEGELPDHFDCQGGGQLFAALQHGISILARDGADAAAMHAVARTCGDLIAAAAPRSRRRPTKPASKKSLSKS